MKFDVLTIFPDIIHHYASASILGRAQNSGHINVRVHNLRDSSTNKWGHVDDKPYGGGPGMILQVEPIYKTLEKLKLVKNGKKINRTTTKVIIMDPAGKPFTQRTAEKYAKLKDLVIICGRYEGFDERVYKFVDEKVTIGEYVLAGGELPALTIIEATARLRPGVLGNEKSLDEETFGSGGKEYPQYTRPEDFMGLKVPKALLSGHHEKIALWKQKKTKK